MCDGIVGRAARERRQAEANGAGLLWLDLINPSKEHMVPGVDYVKQRWFLTTLRLPIQTGCRRRAHTLREWLRFNLHSLEILSMCNLKRATRTPFNLLNHSLLSTVVIGDRHSILENCLWLIGIIKPPAN